MTLTPINFKTKGIIRLFVGDNYRPNSLKDGRGDRLEGRGRESNVRVVLVIIFRKKFNIIRK